MIIPVRCFSCGKVRSHTSPNSRSPINLTTTQVIGDLWERYLQILEELAVSDPDSDDHEGYTSIPTPSSVIYIPTSHRLCCTIPPSGDQECPALVTSGKACGETKNALHFTCAMYAFKEDAC